MPPTWFIRLLGRFEVVVDGRPVPPDAWRSRRAADLVKLLALDPEHRIHRDRVMVELWPDLGAEAAGANLRKAVHYARRAVGESALSTASGVLALDGDVEVDATRLERAAQAAIESGDAASARDAADAYTGDLLPGDPYEPWLDEPRERLRRRYLDLLRVAERWDRVSELDPTDEAAVRALIERDLREDRRSSAIHRFERLRATLRDELGVAPEPETVSLYERVLRLDGPEATTPAERAQALLAWALVHRNRMELDEAERKALNARELALQAGLGHELGEASTLLAFIAFARGDWEDTFREEFVRTIRTDDPLAMPVYDAHLCFAEFFMYGAEGHERAERYARELLGLASAAGFVAGEALARLLLGEIFLVTGRLDEAERELGRAAELYRSCDSLSGQAIALERAAEAEIGRGHHEAALGIVARAHPLAAASAIPGHLVVRVHGVEIAAIRDARRAAEHVQRAERSMQRMHVCEPCSMAYHVRAAITGARALDLELARAQLDVADRISGLWQGGPWVAAVWEARAELSLAEGDAAKAAASFLEAADGFARSSRPVDERRCRAAAAAAA